MTTPEPLRLVRVNSLLTGGGTDEHCVTLAAQLVRLGVEEWLVGPDGREFSRVARAAGLRLVPTPPEGPLRLRFIASLAKAIRGVRPHLVHAHHGRDYWPTVLAARLAGARARLVFTRHLAKSPASLPGRWLLLGRVDAIIAASEFVAAVLRRGHFEPRSPVRERRRRPPMRGDHRKIHVIYDGVDVEGFRPRPADDATVARLRADWALAPEHFAFGVVGGFPPPHGKGQRQFFAAAALIRAHAPHARFLLLGRGDLRPVLEADIARLGLAGAASLAGWCPDMPAAMNALDCLVLPQIGTEAFPGVVLEALACGRPVIASDLDGIPEAFAACPRGRLVKPGDEAALAAAMLEIAQTPRPTAAERAAMHAAVAARFTPAHAARQTLALYHRLLGWPETAGAGEAG
jgi:glycosyltransferase involved in cell wall biosynthesis